LDHRAEQYLLVLVRLTLPPPWMVEPRETVLLPSALLLEDLKPMPASAPHPA